jgi:hypothetical protein
MAQNIDVSVDAPDFDVAIVGSIPLVHVVGHVDHTIVEAKSSELFSATFVHISFDLDPHGVPAIVARRNSTEKAASLGSKAQDPRPLPIRLGLVAAAWEKADATIRVATHS